MQNVASVLTDQFSDLMKRLPAGLDLDHLALETKAIQRKREVVDGARLLRIALARGPGGLSLRQTSAWASMQGIAELSNPGVKYRLDQATAFLAALVPLHRDYDSLTGYAFRSFSRAFSVVNIQLIWALSALRCFSQAAISTTS